MQTITLFRIPLVIFLVGILFNLTGSTFKIMHWASADTFLMAGLIFLVIAIIYTIIIILTSTKRTQ